MLTTDQEKRIILEYISKYLSDKDIAFCDDSIKIYEDKDLYRLFDNDSLERAINYFQLELQVKEFSAPKASSYEVDEYIKTIKEYKNTLIFLVDLEKFYKLFNKKNIKITYPKLLSIFNEAITTKRSEMENEKIILPMYEIISEKFRENISLEKVTKEFLKIASTNIREDYLVYLISKLLDKFNLRYDNLDESKFIKLVKEMQEEISLEEFEQGLGFSRKSDMGSFSELQGYEFEDYLKRLFELMGYGVIRTQLSGDQGADLIASKDGKKIVIQAKKYNGKVSNKAVQEIVAAKNHYRADRAIVITNSSFTKSAIDLSLSNNVELWDGEKLNNMVNNLKDNGHTMSFKLKKGESSQIIKLLCPGCNQEFDYKIIESDMSDGDKFETKCPVCKSAITGKILSKEIIE